MTDQTRSIKAILAEARDTIEATYWIQQAEYSWKLYLDTPEAQAIAVSRGIEQDENVHSKEVLVDGDWLQNDAVPLQFKTKEDGKTYTQITHVCSIGAVALSSAVLYEEPLANYGQVALRDQFTRGAGLVLGHTLVTMHPGHASAESDLDDMIPGWNDDSNTTREDVLEVFTAAVNSPLAEAPELWRFVLPDYTDYTGPLFATKAEAETYGKHFVDYLNDQPTPADPVMEAFGDRFKEEFEWVFDEGEDDPSKNGRAQKVFPWLEMP